MGLMPFPLRQCELSHVDDRLFRSLVVPDPLRGDRLDGRPWIRSSPAPSRWWPSLVRLPALGRPLAVILVAACARQRESRRWASDAVAAPAV